jgi:hypothetical protein
LVEKNKLGIRRKIIFFINLLYIMNEIKHKLFKYMTNEQKTFLLLNIQNINKYKLISPHNKNFVLTGGSNNMEEYENIYDNKSGKYNIELDGIST